MWLLKRNESAGICKEMSQSVMHAAGRHLIKDAFLQIHVD